MFSIRFKSGEQAGYFIKVYHLNISEEESVENSRQVSGVFLIPETKRKHMLSEPSVGANGYYVHVQCSDNVCVWRGMFRSMHEMLKVMPSERSDKA